MNKLVFDARHLQNEYSGLGRYVGFLMKEYIRLLDVRIEKLVIITNSEKFTKIYLERVNETIDHSNLSIVEVPYKPFSLGNYFMFGQWLNREFKGFYFLHPHFDLPLGIKLHSIFIVHDLFPLVVEGYITRFVLIKKIIFKYLLQLSLANRKSKCVSISQSTRSDILECVSYKYIDKVKVVHSSMCVNFGGAESAQCVKGHSLEEPYLFYVGDRRPHKNLKRMVDVFRILKTKYNYGGRFFIAGSERNFNFNVEEYVKDVEGVYLLGKVSETELNQLYSKMDALFFLSKYEGFGLPILEAAVYDRKIITSNISAMPEVAPPTALLIELNMSNDVIANKISSYLFRSVRIDNRSFLSKFSWSNTANNILDLALGNK